MTVRLVVSDIDGTLVGKDKQLSEATVAAVARLREAGVAFTVISARPRSGMLPLIERLGIDGDVAAFNGGTIFRRDGSVSVHQVVESDVAHGVWDMAREVPVDSWLFADDQWFATDLHGPHTDSERRTADQEPAVPEDVAGLLDRADKITFVSDDEPLLRDLAARMVDAYGDRATIVQSQTYYLDVTATEANKGVGLARLCVANDVPEAETAAIGDQANDLPMLRRAGLAIAMGNAPDAVKAVAAHTTRSNIDDGVAHAIDTLILPHTSLTTTGAA